jgi:hypothetical protein
MRFGKIAAIILDEGENDDSTDIIVELFNTYLGMSGHGECGAKRGGGGRGAGSV